MNIESEKPLVLAADDSRIVRMLIQRTLEREYRVELVTNGNDAIKRARELRPDVIISDIDMPELDGLSMLKLIKADPSICQIPLILLTGMTESESRINSLNAGAHDYLLKPIGPKELIARVGAACRQHGMYKELDRSHRQLALTHKKLVETQSQLLQAQKLEAIGLLAAGIAHEINTPLQYVGDNAVFLRDGLKSLVKFYKQSLEIFSSKQGSDEEQKQCQQILEFAEQEDLEFFTQEIPKAIEQSLSGLAVVSEIVLAMKDFSHPGSQDMTPSDINKIIKNTATVARNEWKYHAEIEFLLEPKLPLVSLLAAEFSQVILNIIVNAAHAIADKEDCEYGKISIATSYNDDLVTIEIQDNGSGMAADTIEKIYDPFFTTKAVGRGTGQGLSIARNVVVDKHDGTIDCHSTLEEGTCFTIQLPLLGAALEKKAQSTKEVESC